MSERCGAGHGFYLSPLEIDQSPANTSPPIKFRRPCQFSALTRSPLGAISAAGAIADQGSLRALVEVPGKEVQDVHADFAGAGRGAIAVTGQPWFKGNYYSERELILARARPMAGGYLLRWGMLCAWRHEAHPMARTYYTQTARTTAPLMIDFCSFGAPARKSRTSFSIARPTSSPMGSP